MAVSAMETKAPQANSLTRKDYVIKIMSSRNQAMRSGKDG
jgi:hypothetical protein